MIGEEEKKEDYYECSGCGLELVGKEEVSRLPTGKHYTAGDFSQCPVCGSENAIVKGSST